MLESASNISGTDVTEPRTWEQTSCEPPSCQGHHQMSRKTITIAHSCEGGAAFVAWKDLLNSQSTFLVRCTRYSVRLHGKREVPVVQWCCYRQQPRCLSIHVIAFTPSLPACQCSPGQAHGSTHNCGAEKKKTLYSDTNAARGEIRKVTHTLVQNIVTVDDVRCKVTQSVSVVILIPWGCTVKEQITKPSILRTYKPYKILSCMIYIPFESSMPKQNIICEHFL